MLEMPRATCLPHLTHEESREKQAKGQEERPHTIDQTPFRQQRGPTDPSPRPAKRQLNTRKHEKQMEQNASPV